MKGPVDSYGYRAAWYVRTTRRATHVPSRLTRSRMLGVFAQRLPRKHNYVLSFRICAGSNTPRFNPPRAGLSRLQKSANPQVPVGCCNNGNPVGSWLSKFWWDVIGQTLVDEHVEHVRFSLALHQRHCTTPLYTSDSANPFSCCLSSHGSTLSLGHTLVVGWKPPQSWIFFWRVQPAMHVPKYWRSSYNCVLSLDFFRWKSANYIHQHEQQESLLEAIEG